MTITSTQLAPATTGTQIDGSLQNTFATQDDTGVANVRTCFEKKRYTFPLAVATAFATTAFEVPIQINDFKFKASSVQYLPAAALTSNSTNFQTITVEKGDLVGGARTVVASVATTPAGSGSWTALVPVPLTITASTATVLADQILTFKIAPAAGGVVVPAGTLIVDGYINV